MIEYHHRKCRRHSELPGTFHTQESGKHARWAIMLTAIAKERTESGTKGLVAPTTEWSGTDE